MEIFKRHWSTVPRGIRRPLVLMAGSLLMIAAALTGPLPGPGGIPLFLVGIAVLATEFEWAQKVRDVILRRLETIAAWWKRHKIIGTFLALAGAAAGVAAGAYLYHRL